MYLSLSVSAGVVVARKALKVEMTAPLRAIPPHMDTSVLPLAGRINREGTIFIFVIVLLNISFYR